MRFTPGTLLLSRGAILGMGEICVKEEVKKMGGYFYFSDMSNEEYAAFGLKNCQVKRYDF